MTGLVDIFEHLAADQDLETLLGNARDSRRFRPDRALSLACAALLHLQGREPAYGQVTRLLADLFLEQGQPRLALSAAWYAGSKAEQGELLQHVPPLDRARTRVFWADTGEGHTGAMRQAAEEAEAAGCKARAAIYYERATDMSTARGLWSRLAEQLEDQSLYAAGLAHFNVARTSRQLSDGTTASRATVAAARRLEEAADRFEALGQRERAFDCYQVLVAIGDLNQQFEHVLEGSVNAIRVLCEDNLREDALGLFERSITRLEQGREYAAAAILAREMAHYADNQGQVAAAARGVLLQGELWARAAEEILAHQRSPKLAENALSVASLAYVQGGQYQRAAQTYAALERLDLDAARKARYARGTQRCTASRDQPRLTPAPGAIEEQEPLPDLWHVDLLEWEQAGSAAEACADVLLDPREQLNRTTRRGALLGRLVALAAEQAPESQQEQAGVLVAKHLAPIQVYELLSPLEKLYASPSSKVRQAAIQALSRYFFKRTFVTVEAGLRDRDPAIVREAARLVERLRFDHALEPLSRIYRTTPNRSARISALKAIARIDTREAAELVLGVLDHGGPEERQAVLGSVSTVQAERFITVARAAYCRASPRLRRTIEELFRARAVPLDTDLGP